jgi:hypothetical protein
MAPRPFSRRQSLAFALGWAIALNSMAQNLSQASQVKIRVTIDGTAFTGTLNDNPTAKDFLSLLPLTVTLEDYAATEKITYLPRKLATANSPAGSKPSVGGIAYYAPWGNLALFYKDAAYARGLVTLGRLEPASEALRQRGPLKATIERVQQ